MRLERVEIVGFKSFCDRQELSFPGGVTGIVGPNGCGKSNISDAISWVLGEQSVKSLRGTSMEDVIFAGSQSRQPLGMAEVSLKLSGLNGASPDGRPERVVTRRLYRNGDSEYLMNGELCRLRDIHEMFMDTGLGSKAYSIIEQGKIGLILSSKPADRRVLLEEAAGITKYRARRRQTILKLEAAQQNLLRVNDIVHEVEKQLEGLRRQAGRARRYRALREQIQARERVLFGLRFQELDRASSSLAARLAAQAERERAASTVLGTEEAQAEVRRQALHEEEALLAQARQRLAEAAMAADRHQGRSGFCRDQMAEATARQAEAREEAADLERRLVPLDAELSGRLRGQEALQRELEAAEEEAGSAEDSLQQRGARLQALEAAQDSAREAQLEALTRASALHNARESVGGTAERASAGLLKLAAEREELERERARVTAAAEAARQARARCESLCAELGRGRDQETAAASGARDRADALAREADALESEVDGLAGRRCSLEEMVATHSAFDEGVRALLDRPQGFEVLGVVADLVETDSTHERAVEAFLRDRLQAVLVPDATQALAGIRQLERSGAGRASFLPLDGKGRDKDGESLRAIARREPKARGLVGELYRLTGERADGVRASLPDGLLFASLEDALEARARHPDLTAATLSGETVRGPLLEGGRGVKGLLAPRREVREIAAREQELGDRLSGVRERAEQESAHLRQAEALARSLEGQIHAAEKERVAIDHSLSAALEEEGRLARKAGVVETERSQAEQELHAAEARLAEIEQALQEAQAVREAGAERLAGLGSAVAEARRQSEAAQVRYAESGSRLAALRERVAAGEAECLRLREDDRELRERQAAARGRAEDSGRRAGELEAERAEVERLLAEALIGQDRSGTEAAQAEEHLRALRQELEGREQGLKERRRERETLKEALAELEIARARLDSDRDHLGRECQQAVGLPPAEAARLLTPQDEAEEATGFEAQVRDLRERLERLGPVNPLAVEQAQELEERHRFLSAQRQDLLDSIAELDQAVKKIDRTSRERFQEAFQAINQHFGEVFRQLFGGGTAGLSLIDPDDLLESGLDVMAQPPGKRLQSVMLLSGGEKALTAIALLFAIFQHKPSPFCILDEVDAPLDDANIGRFLRMLEGLKEQTQFVLITHSRKTMQIADQLYGVTMEEPGVSKLVSVRFG